MSAVWRKRFLALLALVSLHGCLHPSGVTPAETDYDLLVSAEDAWEQLVDLVESDWRMLPVEVVDANTRTLVIGWTRHLERLGFDEDAFICPTPSAAFWQRDMLKTTAAGRPEWRMSVQVHEKEGSTRLSTLVVDVEGKHHPRNLLARGPESPAACWSAGQIEKWLVARAHEARWR